ncbi:uncharacterized protein FFE2_16042 [Fusarium fujikuroi]|nr:uncharacterized protein FFE2_16042 [Fusarium fujikuroi]
MQEIHYNP